MDLLAKSAADKFADINKKFEVKEEFIQKSKRYLDNINHEKDISGLQRKTSALLGQCF